MSWEILSHITNMIVDILVIFYILENIKNNKK